MLHKVIEMKIETSDLIYIALVTLLAFFILTQVKEVPLDSYTHLAGAKLSGTISSSEILRIPVILGVFASAIIYLALRLKFQPLPVFIAMILTITSGTFINNFVLGAFSLPVAALFGNLSLYNALSIQQLLGVILLVPFAIFSFLYLVYKRDYSSRMNVIVLLSAILGIVLSFAYSLFALPFLALCSAYSIQRFVDGKGKEDKKETLILGFSMFVGVSIFLMSSISAASIVLSIFTGIIVSLLLYLTESRGKLNLLILLTLVILSVVGGAVNVFSIQRIDSETIDAISHLSQIQGKVAVASVYDGIDSVVYYVSGKSIEKNEGLSYIFSDASGQASRDFDYILIDTLVLDNPKNYSAKVNKTARFETFAFYKTANITSETQNYTAAIFYSMDGSTMMMPIDASGKASSDKVIIGNDWISRFSLLELNATGGHYRFINPRGDSNKNVLRILFPDQLLYNGSSLIWQSNTSRMRLYKLS